MRGMSSATRLVIAAVVLVLGVACARPTYDTQLRTWDGKDWRELVRAWGRPSELFEAADGSSIVLVYRHVDGHTVVSGGPFDCVTTFFIKHDVVSRWTYSGERCPFAPSCTAVRRQAGYCSGAVHGPPPLRTAGR